MSIKLEDVKTGLPIQEFFDTHNKAFAFGMFKVFCGIKIASADDGTRIVETISTEKMHHGMLPDGTRFLEIPKIVANDKDEVVLLHAMDGAGEYRMNRIVASIAVTMLANNWTLHSSEGWLSEKQFFVASKEYERLRDAVYTLAEETGCMKAAYDWLD